jgi:hypothetical protein
MRPRKTTVEYFPHRTSSGRTIFILENLYGNDGYACWFKILELLGSSPGHFYDFNGAANFQYLCAKMGVSGEKTLLILKTLADVDAIDRDLHAEGIIWSDNFVSGLDSVYSKRGTGCPGKPGLRNRNTTSPVVSGTETRVSGVRNTGRKGKEREVKEVKEEKGITTSCPDPKKEGSELVAVEPVLRIPLNLKDTFFDVMQEDVDQWQEAFQGIDVVVELRKCQQWNISHREKRKTIRGIRGHIVAWLGRAQDSSGSLPPRKGSRPVARSVRDAINIQSEEIAKVLNDEQRHKRVDAVRRQEDGIRMVDTVEGSGIRQRATGPYIPKISGQSQ